MLALRDRHVKLTDDCNSYEESTTLFVLVLPCDAKSVIAKFGMTGT